ncbi:MAG: CPBP family intramembrane metalloprotease [Candidatus Bathyarchaeota archaeon]|nr:MAG: CPBP family intramembrane metalloprotease [Candidatus Bathyarchaeota archaeon]
MQGRIVDRNSGERDVRRFALIALSIYALDKIVISFVNVFGSSAPLLRSILVIPFLGVLFDWILPIFVVFAIEKRDLRSLGLDVGRNRYGLYAALAFIGLILPALVVGVDWGLVVELVEQLVYIGLAEELYFRGYLMGRFRDWLGDLRGLLLNGLVFGLAHFIFLVSRYGFTDLVGDASIGIQTFLGGLLFGYIYLKSGDIVPGAILHISMNAYLSRLL